MTNQNLTKFITIIFSVLFLGCKSNVEIINAEIDKNFNTELTDNLRPVVSTMEFYYYAVPENYWYPDGTTAREIIEDEVKHGYQNLGKLDKLIRDIQTNDEQITLAIDSLHNRITVERKKIRKAQKAMEQVNSIFGFGLYGGMTGLYDFGTMLSGSSSDEDDEMKMPKEVLEAFENLNEAIISANFRFLLSVQQFEGNMIGKKSLSEGELSTVRLHIKDKIRNEIKSYYTGSDTTARNEATERLLDSYDKHFTHKN